MMIRIDSLVPDDVVTLRYHGTHGNETYEEQATFLSREGEGEDRIVYFATQDGTDEGFYRWSAYRYKGRWAYGTGADRLQVVKLHLDF